MFGFVRNTVSLFCECINLYSTYCRCLIIGDVEIEKQRVKRVLCNCFSYFKGKVRSGTSSCISRFSNDLSFFYFQRVFRTRKRKGKSLLFFLLFSNKLC